MSLSKPLNKFGGVNSNNIDGVDHNVRCQHCRLILLKPVQLTCCGTHLCLWCSRVGLPDIRPFVCPFCHAESQQKQVACDRAKQRELDAISLQCYRCSWSGSYLAYVQHLQDQHAHLECPDCQQHFYAINLFEEHREEACPDRLITCSLAGCAQSIKRSKLVEHYLTKQHQQRLLGHTINCTRQRNKEHQEMLAMLRNDLAKSAVIIVTVNDHGTRLRSTSHALRSSMDSVQQQLQTQMESCALVDESMQCSAQAQAEMRSNLERIHKGLTVGRVLYLDENGLIVLLFDTLGSVYSPKFRTNACGYAFMVHVDNISDASCGDERWLSVFICLMQSDTDPILVFPFPYDIHLCLHDQSGQRKHICAVVKADDHAAAFSCPTTERNDEVGIAKFCPLTYLTDSECQYRVSGRYLVGVYMDFLGERSHPFSSV